MGLHGGDLLEIEDPCCAENTTEKIVKQSKTRKSTNTLTARSGFSTYLIFFTTKEIYFLGKLHRDISSHFSKLNLHQKKNIAKFGFFDWSNFSFLKQNI